MTIESAKAFVERVKNDEEFAKQIAGAKSREERAEIAKAEGFDFTPEEGKVVVETEDGKRVEFEKGDFVRFPKGLSCVWDIKEPVKKHYDFK